MKVGKNTIISPKVSIYGGDRIEIGDNVRVDDFCILSSGSSGEGYIKIGSHSHIPVFCALFGGAGIILEDFATLCARDSLYSESDDFSGESLMGPMILMKYKIKYKKGLIYLKRHTIIGTGAIIMPGVTTEEGTCIGAFSLVNKSCTVPWSFYAGVPAKLIRERKKGMLELEKQFLKEYEERNK